MIRLLVVTSAAIGLILFVALIVSKVLRARTTGLSIRMQIFLALALIVGTFAFGLGLMVIDRIEARAVRVATQAARDEAEITVQVIERTLADTVHDVDELVARLSAGPPTASRLSIEVVSPSGALLYPTGGSSKLGGRGTVHYDAPLHLDGRFVGSVRVVKPTIVMQRLLADFAPTVLVISLVLGAVAALAAVWIGRTIGHPLEVITRFAERVSQGERAQTPALTGGAREVVRLSHSIDSMRRQLEGRPFVETFAADLSHELKNPVAAIRAAAEVLEEGALADEDRARRFLARILEASARIDRLLRDLVNLARIEARGVERLAPVDLGELTRTIIESIGDAGERFVLQATGDLRVRGEVTWLGRAITNLLNNAMVHSPEGSPVSISLVGTPKDVSCSISSSGQVSKHVRGQLFRRFVTTRPDKGGSGLGLAIVRAVAEAHGGQVELAEPGPPTVRFLLLLPPLGSASGSAQPTPRTV